jgi:hypothetical protein
MEAIRKPRRAPVKAQVPAGTILRGALQRPWEALVGASASVVGIALIAGLVMHWLARDPDCWLGIKKNQYGVLEELAVKEEDIPKKVLADLPRERDQRILDEQEVRELAVKHGLFNPRRVNPVLCYGDGDITYWTEQGRAAWKLELEFLARRLLLDAAERHEIILLSRGQLTNWSQRIYFVLLKKTRAHWKKQRR